jgi:predicted ATP-dependent Lon-type protease
MQDKKTLNNNMLNILVAISSVVLFVVVAALGLCLEWYRHVKNKLVQNGTVKLLTCFIIQTDIKSGKVRFSIPNVEIKATEAIIPVNVLSQHKDNLADGEKWGVIELNYIPPQKRNRARIELAEYKLFRPYRTDLNIIRNAGNFFLPKNGWIFCSLPWNTTRMASTVWNKKWKCRQSLNPISNRVMQQ